jgi:hemoglobin
MTESLFDRIGGNAAVNAAVDLFYQKVMADDLIRHFFDATDMNRQRAQQKAFLAFAFGGPNNYTGRDMRAAHAPLVEKGLNDDHFNAVAGHLQETLEELGVDAGAIAEVMAIAGGARNDVLNR